MTETPDRADLPDPPATGEGGDTTPRELAAPAAFSLRALFLFMTVCAVLAALASLVVHVPGAADRASITAELAEMLVTGTAILLPPFAALAAWLVSGRWWVVILTACAAVPFGAVLGAVLVLPDQLQVVQILITCGASLGLLAYGVRLGRRRHLAAKPDIPPRAKRAL